MPHLTCFVAEHDLSQHPPGDLVEPLARALVAVYGEPARAAGEIMVVAVPSGTWVTLTDPGIPVGPRIDLRVRAALFDRDDAADLRSAAFTTITDAIAGVLGNHLRERVQVELTAVSAGRSAVGGRPVD